jgi:hypothetical protein
MPGCIDQNGKTWNVGTIICKDDLQYQCYANGAWNPTGYNCDGSEANAPAKPAAPPENG